ncbi:hypothetical protein LSAT2_008076 [Lamellibrachia satsuma]|nr:hypothetical protein LSAT2_008076 [Lamellibrachia satsuma]
MCGGEAKNTATVDIMMKKITGTTNAYCRCTITRVGSTTLTVKHEEVSSLSSSTDVCAYLNNKGEEKSVCFKSNTPGSTTYFSSRTDPITISFSGGGGQGTVPGGTQIFKFSALAPPVATTKSTDSASTLVVPAFSSLSSTAEGVSDGAIIGATFGAILALVTLTGAYVLPKALRKTRQNDVEPLSPEGSRILNEERV